MLKAIDNIPEGYSEGIYQGVKYGITKNSFNKGKSFKVFAKELGGHDYISFNFYLTSEKEMLKPCEMPREKVIDFVSKVQLVP